MMREGDALAEQYRPARVVTASVHAGIVVYDLYFEHASLHDHFGNDDTRIIKFIAFIASLHFNK